MVSRDPRGEQAGEPDGSAYLRDAVPGGAQLVQDKSYGFQIPKKRTTKPVRAFPVTPCTP
jgi:hypothetical protein